MTRGRAGVHVARTAICLAIALVSVPGWAALSPVKLRVGGSDVPLRSTCVRDEHDVYLPLDALNAFGITGRVAPRQDSVFISGAGRRSAREIALARPGREPMIPLSALCQALGMVWTVSEGTCTVEGSQVNRARVAPPLQRSESPDAPLRSSSAGSPGKPVATPPASRSTPGAGRDPVLSPDPRLHVGASRRDDAGPSSPSAVLILQQPESPDSTEPTSPAVPSVAASGAEAVRPVPPAPVRITEVRFEPIDDGHAQIRLRGDGKLAGSARILANPSRLAIDVPSSVVDAGQTQWPVQHPFLTSIRSATEPGGITQIIVDLARLVSYRLLGGPNSLTVQLALPRGAGRRMKDLIVAIDAGHGGPKTGCSAVVNGKRILEKDLNLAIAKHTATLLEEAGARVVMTRTDDSDISLGARPAMAATNSADLFISIHIDDCPGPVSASGTTVYYHGYDSDSRSLAISLSGRIARISGIPERGATSDLRLFASGIAVLRKSRMPAVLLEVGFLSHPVDRRKVLSQQFRVQIAQAIVDGVRGYAEGSLPESPLPPVEGWTR